MGRDNFIAHSRALVMMTEGIDFIPVLPHRSPPFDDEEVSCAGGGPCLFVFLLELIQFQARRRRHPPEALDSTKYRGNLCRMMPAIIKKKSPGAADGRNPVLPANQPPSSSSGKSKRMIKSLPSSHGGKGIVDVGLGTQILTPSKRENHR